MQVVVETTNGKIMGIQGKGCQSFLGIPYAMPPVGKLRFCGPQPMPAWKGIKDARRFGPSAPQTTTIWPGCDGDGRQSEDCLYLNIYTPKADAAKRPVMFWIHGGGFTHGSGSQDMFRGFRLAVRGDVVLVTINYRMGIFGFLNFPEIAPNIGLQDQAAALKWVYQNISIFGGDSENITIFGESAGGISAVHLMAMDRARNLFRRVISQSGSIFIYPQPVDSDETAHIMTRVIGSESTALKVLQRASVEKLMDIQAKFSAELNGRYIFLPFRPIIDGDVLPESPLETIQSGKVKEKQLLIGSNKDELKSFFLTKPEAALLDDHALLNSVRSLLRTVGGKESSAEELIDAYGGERGLTAGTPFDILTAIYNDCHFRIPALITAESQRRHQVHTYAYLFTWESPVLDGNMGASHALEVPFIFGTLDSEGMAEMIGAGERVNKLSDTFMDAWSAFATEGNPNHASITAWEPYDRLNRATMLFGRKVKQVFRPFESTRAQWDKILDSKNRNE